MDCYTIIVVRTFICFLMISVGKSEIKITDQSSWLSPHLFSKILGVSLKRSKCTNVHVAGDSVAIETTFRDFTRIYSLEYVLMNTTNDCDGHFMISTSADLAATLVERVPGKPSTEILIIIDDEVQESSMLLNGSLYGYANVNIISRNSLRSLSETLLEPRVFKKVSSYHEILRKRKLPNFHGRELRATAVYNPPYSYLRTTQNRIIGGIETEVFFPKNDNLYNNDSKSPITDPELDRVEVKLFLLIAEKLNFKWIIRRPSGENPYGGRNGTHLDAGLIGHIHHKQVEIAFTSLWLTRKNFHFANLTQPWIQISVHFLVPRPKSHRVSWALTIPFLARVWLATFVLLLVESIYIYAKAWISPKVPRRFRNFVVTMTELMGRLVGDSVTDRIPGLRVQFQLWHFIGILLTTAYTSNLAANLASLDYESRIDTTRDLAAANLTWGYNSATGPWIFFDKSDPWARQFHRRFEPVKDEAERHAKIMRGNHAILGKIVDGVFIPHNEVRTSDLKNYRVMRDPTARYYLAFATQPWLLESVNEVIVRLREAGITAYHLRDVIRRREPPERQEVFIEYDVGTGEPRVLKLIPLTVGFAVLIVGLAISSFVFYLELRYARGKTSIRQLLRRIDRKRKIQRDKEITGKRGIFAMRRLRSRNTFLTFVR